MDWSELLALDDGVRLRRGVTDAEIGQAENELGARLPEWLQSLYRLTDGVLDEPGQWFVIWPLADVVERHRVEPTGPQQCQPGIRFGDDGTGNVFCVRAGDEESVHHWSSSDQQATKLADDLPRGWSAWVADALPPH